MLCTCIYFADIGSFDGNEMLDPPHDPGVNLDDYDQEMADALEDEADGTAERRTDPVPHGASVPPFARRGRPKTRYRMELGNQLCGLISKAGIRPAHYREIQGDDRLLRMWRGMPRDMYGLMLHVVGAMTAVTRLRRIVCSYRHSRAAARDRQSANNDLDASRDHSPRGAPNDQHEAPLPTSDIIHHGDEVGPSATSSQQPTASIMSTSHNHYEQAGPSTVEAAVLLTGQASTTTAPHIDHVVLPRADASISTSDHHDHEQASRPLTVEAAPSYTE